MSKSQAVCRYFASGGTCFYGNDCQFVHDSPDNVKSNDASAVEMLNDQVVFAGYDLPAESKLSSYIGTRVPKEQLTNSLSNLTIQDVAVAREFIPANRGSSLSLNNVSTQPMPHSTANSNSAFVKGSHLMQDRESPDDSPIVTKRSFVRNPSPSTVNGGDYGGMYQESLGGTTYFYQPHGDENGGSSELISATVPGPETDILPATCHIYPGQPTNVEHMKPKANAPSFFMPDELRLDILNRAAIVNSRVNPDLFPDLPQQIDNYTNICPIEHQVSKSSCYGLMTSVYKATNIKTGGVYCLRRIHGFKLSSTKTGLEIVDLWKKIQHSNLVQLRELFTTKAFGDNSVVFVYDFFPGAQTMKQVYFGGHHHSGSERLNVSSYNGGSINGKGRVGSRIQNESSLRQGHGLLPESLIWTYVVQLSSALRTIHSANLALRCLDPSKVLLSSAGKSRLRLNCAAIVDMITLDSNQQQQQRTSAMIHHHQKEDLNALGRLILCLACNSATVFQFADSSMDLVAKNYSSDLRNLLLLLLSLPPRFSSINDVMPMIGARFYTQLDAAQMRSDVIEAELAKEVESSRLFRLVVKLGTINERPELNEDPAWSETGDRYMLMLFRNYLFHQCDKDGKPWLDMAHIIQCLNKLDAGVDEKICLVSQDGFNVLVVSYSELKRCIDSAFGEIYTKL